MMTAKEQYNYRKANGICPQCGVSISTEEKDKKNIYCSKCMTKRREAQKRMREKRKYNSLCIHCGKNYVDYNHVYCDECMEFYRNYYKHWIIDHSSEYSEKHKEKIQDRKAKHLCIACGRKLSSYCKTVKCPRCIEKSKRYTAVKGGGFE